MNIAILGVGVIGTLYGWALSKNNQVVHIVRPDKVSIVDGMRYKMDIIDERHEEKERYVVDEYTIKAISSSYYDSDLIIVAVSEQQLEQALIDLIQSAPNSKYLFMCSNWKGVGIIDKYLEKNQYILGYAGGGGTIRENNNQTELWGNIGDDIILGKVYPAQEKMLEDVVELFTKIHINPEVQDNILHWLWVHNVDSSIIGAALSKYMNVSRFIEDEKLINTCFLAMNEGFEICHKKGVQLNLFPETELYKMPFSDLYPMFKNNFETNEIMQRYTAHAIKSIPEMKHNFLEIYNEGKKQDIPMPNLDELFEIITEIK